MTMELPTTMGRNEKGASIVMYISFNTYITCFLFPSPNKGEYNFYVSGHTSYRDKNGLYKYTDLYINNDEIEEYHKKYYNKLKDYFENG